MSGTKICPYCNNEISVYALKCQFCGEWQRDKKAQSYSGDTLTQVRLSLSSRYEVLEEIGRGGMAVVYKARQISLNRLVALKVVHQNLVHDKEFLSRFHREAQLSASLDHPNIVTIHDTGREGQVHYVAMEYLEGKNLQVTIHEKGRLGVQESLDYLVPIADALNYAHQRGIIHRDIKSSNIFITHSGRPVLMDFGIAHAASQTRLTMTSSILGTPEYMSPEQADGVKVDKRTDIYSLGIVLYEALTGNVPFSGDNPLSVISHVKQTPPAPPSKFNKKIPQWLEGILLKALEKKPQDRIHTGAEFMDLVKKKKVPPKNSTSINVRFLNIAAVLIILTMGGTLTYYFYPNLPEKITERLEDIFKTDTTKELLIKAQSAFNMGNYLNPENENALHFANRVLEDNPGNIHAKSIKDKIYRLLMEKGSQAFEQGNYEKAESIYINAFRVFPKEEEPRSIIITKFQKQGKELINELKIADARTLYQGGLAIARIEPSLEDMSDQMVNKVKTADTLERIIDKGAKLKNKGKYSKALSAYNKALKLKIGSNKIRESYSKTASIAKYVRNGNRALSQNDCNEAIAAFQKANNLDPNNPFLKDRLNEAQNCFSIGLDMVHVQGGSFQMGCQNQQAGCEADEKPVHTVRLSSFYISKHEVTNARYCKMLNEIGNPVRGGSKCIDLGDSKIQKSKGRYIPKKDYADHPVSGVTWHGARAFCRWLTNKTNKRYRLPTEAEWEYAARGGQQSNGYIYSGSNEPGKIAWYNTNQTHPVGEKAPNELGLHDMSGNVAEWCYGRYDHDYYNNTASNDPRNASNGKSRVIRGGHWAKGPDECRVANRTSLRPEYSYEIYGFRVCSN